MSQKNFQEIRPTIAPPTAPNVELPYCFPIKNPATRTPPKSKGKICFANPQVEPVHIESSSFLIQDLRIYVRVNNNIIVTGQ